MHRLSVIVPVFEQAELLSACLATIRASIFSDYELLVSDDGSADEALIRAVADHFGATLVRGETRRGSAVARNRAVAVATGDVLVFIDADVTIRADTLDRLAAGFDRTPTPDAVIGSYDRDPAGHNRTSHFRNLLHSHAHQRSGGDASTFWTGCGAIRRQRFLELGGFNESINRPSIEDVELGLRLHASGGRILLDPEIQVKHHKDWTLRRMVWTDLTARAMPWAALIRDHGLPRDLNFRIGDRVAAALSVGLVPLAILTALHGLSCFLIFAATVAAIAILQRSFLRFLAKSKGILFTIGTFPLLILYNVTCVAGLIAGLVRAERRRDLWLLPTILTCLSLILGIQFVGGAYRAEFNAFPDEPSHFVSGLMVYDYLTSLPRENPMKWAERYYLHYPKVAIGHWPPLFFVMEAGWWMFFPPSRASAMALNALLLLLAVTVFYCRMRDAAPAWLAGSAALLLLVAPTVQQSAGQSMAEAACLLWSVLLLDALTRLLRRPSPGMAMLVGFWLVCALLTKGTGFCLVAAPVLALVLSGQVRLLMDRRIGGAAGVIVLAALAWYALQATVLNENFRWLAGIGVDQTWAAASVIGLAGYGFCILAIAGALSTFWRRRPSAVAAVSILCSVLITSVPARAMRESRHFIIVLPALLLLAVEFVQWTRLRTRFGLALMAVAIVLFPFQLYRQRPAGFAELSRELRLPERMLVSSDSTSEGAWIAEVALREKRPGSMIVRATKVLATDTWSGRNYTLLARTPAQAARTLDELSIDMVIVAPSDGTPVLPHQMILQDALRTSPAWRLCASAGRLAAWRRIRPAAVPRRPLVINLRDKIGMMIEEK